MTPLLRCRGICKSFPGVTALAGVDFEVNQGEVHALAGENGAGKSTLMHILAGVYQPDAGSIEFEGCPVRIPNERHAQQMGIGIVFQERSLFDLLSVGENIFAGNQPVTWGGMIDRAQMHAKASALLQRIGLDVDPSELSAAFPPRSSRWWRSPRLSLLIRGSSFWMNPPLPSPYRKPKRCFVLFANCGMGD